MFELNEQDFKKIEPIFKNIDHNVPVVFSVIEGNAPGKIFVDDLNKPKTVFLYPKDSFFYVAGDENNSQFNKNMYELIFEDLLNSNESELVLFSFSDNWRKKLDYLFKEKGAIRIKRKVFQFDEDMFNSIKNNVSKELPNGYLIKQVDKEIAKKIGTTKSWTSIEGFLENGVGKCIINDGEIISACYSIYKGKGLAEVDIFTNETHRGKGFGKIVASSFIESCISKNIKPSWSCWPFRKESLLLAKKLGFIEKESVEAHYWSKNM